MTADRLPITAIVASHNEASLLERCLAPLRFCDEIIVIDIASSDATARVAKQLGATVVDHPWVPIAELARVDIIPQARHDWLLVIDPDEEIQPALARELVELFPTLAPDVGLVATAIVYHFAGRRLEGTVWGGVQPHRLLVRRSAVEVTTTVHGGDLQRREGYVEVRIPYSGDNAVLHHWLTGYRAFVSKHVRYLKLEGPDRARAGQRTGIREVLATPWRSFRFSFVEKAGFRDRWTGLWLSLLWAAYSTAARGMLLRAQRRL